MWSLSGLGRRVHLDIMTSGANEVRRERDLELRASGLRRVFGMAIICASSKQSPSRKPPGNSKVVARDG